MDALMVTIIDRLLAAIANARREEREAVLAALQKEHDIRIDGQPNWAMRATAYLEATLPEVKP